MMSSFSRFNPLIVAPLLAAALALNAAAMFGLLPEAAGIVSGVASLLLGACLFLYFLNLQAVTTAVVETARAIRAGDLEARLAARGMRGDLRKLIDNVNDMIDLNDAFIRESSLTMEAAAENRFYRKMRLAGFNGAQLQAAEKINAAVDRVAERPAIMARLDGSVGALVKAGVGGDFAGRLEADLPDEILNRLARNMNELVETVDRGLTEAGEVLAALARADLRPRMRGEFHGAFCELKDNVNALADNIEQIVAGILAACAKLQASQAEIQSGAADLAQRTSSGATAVEQTSAAMEQISVTTAENARKAASGADRAETVSRSIGDVRTAMEEAVGAVQRMQASSEEISGIVSLIDSIAFQTRLLALNASIEAARAGEAGRGFAVVASEVRNLAERVVSASSEIKGLVAESGAHVRQGSALVGDAGAQLGQILGLIRDNAADMREIAAACGEQAKAVGEISTAVSQLEDNTSSNATLVDRTNSQLMEAEVELARLQEFVRRFTLSRPAGIEGAPLVRPKTAPRLLPQPDRVPDLAPRRASAGKPISIGSAAVAYDDKDWDAF